MIIPVSDIHIDIPNTPPRVDGKKLKGHVAMEDEIRKLFPYDTSDRHIFCFCGDIGERLLGVYYIMKILEIFPNSEAVYVPGNHEFYGYNIDYAYADFNFVNETAERLHVLTGMGYSSCEIDGITFVGGTLWTDFNKGSSEIMTMACTTMNDYIAIKSTSKNRPISPERILNDHHVQRKNIFKSISKALEKNKPVIVLTHHRPILPECIYSTTEYLYSVDLMKDLEALPKLPKYWLCGHHHRSIYKELRLTNGTMTVIENSVGYPSERTKTGFSNLCTLETAHLFDE